MKQFFSWLIAVSCLASSQLPANDLTAEHIESLKSRLDTIKENLDRHLSSRNVSARQQFLAAANDPKAAVELYLDSHKLVNYDRQGRPEADFRAWREGQANQLKDSKFVASLQQQLRYLALSCQAAEEEDQSAIFAHLTSYVDGLSRMEEAPGGNLTQSVANSVFAKAYYLEELLGKNPNWEPVPFNIGGIYEKAIFPYLRENDPGSLMSAWDRRIEQENRVVEMLETNRLKETRGMTRDQERHARSQNQQAGGVLRSLAKEEFANRTLPRLQWGRMKDMFRHVDEVGAARQMLEFVEKHLTHEFASQFFGEFNQLLSEKASKAAASTPTP